MEITVLRYYDSGDATLGLLMINGVFSGAYTLEDEYRDVLGGKKVMGESRIPEGRYRIKLREFGGHHEKYTDRYSFHKGMLEVMDVPGFTDILIHTGNTEKHTMGCLLIGELPSSSETIRDSVKAYKKIYPQIAEAILSGEEVWINYTVVYKAMAA